MFCPNDNVEMRQVKAEAHYGQLVLLDQCPDCGGIWFDKLELYMAKPGEADKIESLDVDNLQTPSDFQNPDLICPRDEAKLIQFKDPYLPRDLVIARCPYCEGLWLNRGEFTKYQKFRQEKLLRSEKNSTDDQLKQDIERILDEHEAGRGDDVLGRLGRFLSTPLDKTPVHPSETDRLSPGEENSANIIIGAISLILRLFLHI